MIKRKRFFRYMHTVCVRSLPVGWNYANYARTTGNIYELRKTQTIILKNIKRFLQKKVNFY